MLFHFSLGAHMIRKPRAGAGWRRVFLRALAGGRSIAQAAREAGIDPSSAHRVRQRDPAFAAAWARARERGVVRLTTGTDGGKAPVLAPDEVVRASKDGRPRIQRAGPGRWSAAKEAVFLETLTGTGNVSAGCRAAGVSNAAAYGRRARLPVFAAQWATALAQGREHLDGLLLGTAVAVLEGAPPEGGAFVAPMTVEQAITVWKMHRHEVTGEGRRPRHDWRRQPATVEEIRAEVMRRVRAVGGG